MLPIRTICALATSLLAQEQKFRFEKSDAQTVELMAEFNQWKGLLMIKQLNGIWRIEVSIPPLTYGYKLLVDRKDWVEAHSEVTKSMKTSGFRKVRLETYGAHDPYSPHTIEALNWFIAESSKDSPRSRESEKQSTCPVIRHPESRRRGGTSHTGWIRQSSLCDQYSLGPRLRSG
jgi:1,4-alpha-glucan branching enzyme